MDKYYRGQESSLGDLTESFDSNFISSGINSEQFSDKLFRQ